MRRRLVGTGMTRYYVMAVAAGLAIYLIAYLFLAEGRSWWELILYPPW